jgi:hypothetical protein
LYGTNAFKRVIDRFVCSSRDVARYNDRTRTKSAKFTRIGGWRLPQVGAMVRVRNRDQFGGAAMVLAEQPRDSGRTTVSAK